MTVELVVCVKCAEVSVVETSKGGSCGGCLEALVVPPRKEETEDIKEDQ